MVTIQQYNSSELITKLDSIINELKEVKQAIKDNNDFNEVVMTEEVSMSKFKESEKTLKSPKTLRNERLEREYKDYMDKDSMPSILY